MSIRILAACAAASAALALAACEKHSVSGAGGPPAADAAEPTATPAAEPVAVDADTGPAAYTPDTTTTESL